MSLPSDILRFFQVESAEIPTLPLKTISDFFEEMDKSYSQQDALQVINAFKISGDLFSFGNFPTSSRSPLKEMLMGLSFNEEKAMHGLYDFKIHGFSAIAPHFRKSVRPVVVELNDGSYDIGTCFLIGKSKYILTAKHVIENTNTIQISNENGELVEACEVIISKEKNIDIAIIIVENDPFKDLPVLVSEDGKILEEVMTIGYPPIPGFDAVQIYEASTINNSFKFSRGQIVANDTAYLDGLNYLIINAKVKGGNSGSPVINKNGNLVGMVVQIPIDSQDASKLDSLGYGIVTPTNEIYKLFRNAEDNENVIRLEVVNHSNGFSLK